MVNLLPTLVGGGDALVVGGGAGKCDGTDPGERTEACELALLQQAMKQENVGIEELVQLSAAVSAPPTAGPLSGVAGAEFMNRGPHPLRERRNAKPSAPANGESVNWVPFKSISKCEITEFKNCTLLRPKNRDY